MQKMEGAELKAFQERENQMNDHELKNVESKGHSNFRIHNATIYSLCIERKSLDTLHFFERISKGNAFISKMSLTSAGSSRILKRTAIANLFASSSLFTEVND